MTENTNVQYEYVPNVLLHSKKSLFHKYYYIIDCKPPISGYVFEQHNIKASLQMIMYSTLPQYDNISVLVYKSKKKDINKIIEVAQQIYNSATLRAGLQYMNFCDYLLNTCKEINKNHLRKEFTK